MRNKKHWFIHLYFLVVFLSGFSFLILEVSWFRLLSLAIGSTISASALVLSAFLSGMGLGAYFIGRQNNKLKLGHLFGVISILGIFIFFAITCGFPYIYKLIEGPWIGYLMAIVVVFLPAFFMGGVLPLIANKVALLSNNRNKNLGQLYAIETLGSFIGAATTGFIFIKLLGQFNTILIACGVMIILSIFEFVFDKKSNLTEKSEVIHNQNFKASNRQKTVISNPKVYQIAFLSTFVCGFLGVSLQTIWFRFFSVYFVNTSYTFATISAMVILGLFLGSWIYSIFSQKIHNKIRVLTISLLLISISTLIGIGLLLNLPQLIMIPLATNQEDYFLRIFMLPILASFLVIVPTIALSGFCFPLIWSIVTEGKKQIGATTGLLLFSNALGSAVGPLMLTFVAIPLFGSVLSGLIPLILVFVLLLLLQINTPHKKPIFSLKVIYSSAIIVSFAILIIHPIFYILPPSFSKYTKKVIGYGETSEGTYIVGQDRNIENPVVSTYVNNSAVIGSTYDAIKAVKMVGHLPFLMGLQCDRALVVGFGIGVTTSAIASHSEVSTIDCVELIPQLKKVAHYYKDLNREVYNDPRLTIHGGDGRHFLQSTHKVYDLISSDPTHPILGSGNIYTKEYFELCKSHLSERGMISQYLPLHKLRQSDFLGIVKTFKSVFPDASLWLGQFHAILIASKSGKSIPIDFTRWQLESQKLPNDPYFYSNSYHLAACMTLNSAQIDEISKNAIVNTDDKSYVEFFSLDAFKGENLPNNLSYLNQYRGGVNATFKNIENPKLLSKYIYSNQILTEGIVEMLKGNNDAYKKAIEKAQAENPENEEYPFLLKLLFEK